MSNDPEHFRVGAGMFFIAMILCWLIGVGTGLVLK